MNGRVAKRLRKEAKNFSSTFGEFVDDTGKRIDSYKEIKKKYNNKSSKIDEMENFVS